MNIQKLGKILIGSLFVMTSIRIFLINFTNFVKFIESKDIPFACIVAIIVLSLKLVCGLIIMTSDNEKLVNVAAYGLIIFVVMTTVLYHNPIKNGEQFDMMMKNIA